jgi:myosin-crossreactive antigen
MILLTAANLLVIFFLPIINLIISLQAFLSFNVIFLSLINQYKSLIKPIFEHFLVHQVKDFIGCFIIYIKCNIIIMAMQKYLNKY